MLPATVFGACVRACAAMTGAIPEKARSLLEQEP
jgi:hypothetical protein